MRTRRSRWWIRLGCGGSFLRGGVSETGRSSSTRNRVGAQYASRVQIPPPPPHRRFTGAAFIGDATDSSDLDNHCAEGCPSGLRSTPGERVGGSPASRVQIPPLPPVPSPIQFPVVAALDGEVAVPCTRNPLERGRIPTPGLVLSGRPTTAALKTWTCATGTCESARPGREQR